MDLLRLSGAGGFSVVFLLGPPKSISSRLFSNLVLFLSASMAELILKVTLLFVLGFFLVVVVDVQSSTNSSAA